MTPEIRIRPDLETLGDEIAEEIAGRIVERVSGTGTFTISLAGGRTPIALYRRLADRFPSKIPWGEVHVYWSDERFVPSGDPASNYGMAMEALLSRVPVAAANIHPLPPPPTEINEAAARYEATLRETFEPGGPLVDLALLGMGIEGHTASLFPGSAVLNETQRWVRPVFPPDAPSPRLTLTFPALNLAREIFFLVSGAEKARAVAQALGGTAKPVDCPVAGIHPAAGITTWWVDSAAAARLPRRQS